jgi:carbonic anhydrase
MNDIDHLFANNRSWARRKIEQDPEYFSRLAEQQAPRYLWIGCSDSRVPANQIVGLAPGEVFVHRNVANLVVFSDLNCLSVIHFAIDVLKVEHIMVVGHYGCGGVKAVLDRRQFGLVDSWLHHVEDLMHTHWKRLSAVADARERADRLCEINVIEQVQHVGRLPMVEEAWRRGQELTIHGLIYGIHDGLLRQVSPPIDGPIDTMAWRRAALRALWARPAGQGEEAPAMGAPGVGAPAMGAPGVGAPVPAACCSRHAAGPASGLAADRGLPAAGGPGADVPAPGTEDD